jgi:putative oxidoreductase
MKWAERTTSMKAAIALLWIVTVLEAAMMGLAGSSKFTGASFWTSSFESWGYPASFAFVIGAVEVAGALLLLAPRLATYAATLLTVIMIGALTTVVVHHSDLGIWAPIANMVALTIIGVGRWKWRLRGATTAV